MSDASTDYRRLRERLVAAGCTVTARRVANRVVGPGGRAVALPARCRDDEQPRRIARQLRALLGVEL